MDQISPKETKQSSSSETERDKLQIQRKWQIALIIFLSLLIKYLPDSPNTLSNHSNLKRFLKSKIDPSNKFSISLITEVKIMKLIANLKENKATGLDGLSDKFLRLAAPVLTKIVLNILNLNKTSHFASCFQLWLYLYSF